MIFGKRKALTDAQKRQYISMAGSIASTLSLPVMVMALLNEKPGVNVETINPDEIIRQLRMAYRCNRLDYAGRYSRAVKVLCRKYKVRIAEMNRMIAEDPAMAKEVYAVMDAEFEMDVARWEKILTKHR